MFAVPALCLLLSGLLMRQEQMDYLELFLLSWATISGILIVYRFNDYTCGFSSPWKPVITFFSDWQNVFLVVQFFLVGIPLSWFYLNIFQFLVLAISGIIGIAYAVNFRLGALSWFPKRKFPIKNILIGSVWAALFIVGLGREPEFLDWVFYVFIAVQVFIGSIIRDVPDVEMDQMRNTKSLPVLLGAKNAIVMLHVFNALSLSLCLISAAFCFYVFFPVAVWRSIGLMFLQQDPNNPYWSQYANLYTCVLIFVGVIFFVM